MPALTPEQARRVYDRIARAQDWQRFYEDAATAELTAHADFDNAHAVVELGCGTGRFAAALLSGHLPADASYVGVDLSPRMVALASERLRQWSHRATVTLVDGGATVPAAHRSADRFVANYVFDLLGPEETRAALSEAHRVLAPGGLLCATGLTPGERGLARFVSRAWTAVWARWPALVGGCRPITLVDEVDSSQWEVSYQRTVVAWGVTSEIFIATRR
jgi:ubiquinone/menaquinone biosynthesis C-methylase UbiE